MEPLKVFSSPKNPSDDEMAKVEVVDNFFHPKFQICRIMPWQS